MTVRHIVILALGVSLCAVPSTACSCGNPIPIQKTSARYQDRAVFRARIIQFLGRTLNSKSGSYSTKAIALVGERYWGLPWYWPRVVVLDGGLICDLGMQKGDYLVSGLRERYGVIEVGGCSRTQPLQHARVDLRTLDGSHCAGPGGTLIGQVWQFKAPGSTVLMPNTPVVFRDLSGKSYGTQADQDGIYELRHVPPGRYTPDSKLANAMSIDVIDGVCIDFAVHLGSD